MRQVRACTGFLGLLIENRSKWRLIVMTIVCPKAFEALEFYADPDSYFAIGFIADPPCGEFIEDGEYFREDTLVDEDTPHARWRPGKRARDVFR